MSARYRALNGPVVVCEDDEPGTVMAMTGRQEDAEEIAAALNSSPSERGWRWYEDPRVGDVIRFHGRRRQPTTREIIRVHDDRVETASFDGRGRNSEIQRRRLRLYVLIRGAA